MRFLRGLGEVYLGLLRRVGSALLVLALAGGVSFLVVYPFWLFATKNRRLYTITVLVLIGGGTVGLVANRVIRRVREDRSYLKQRLVPALRQALLVLLLLGGLYLDLWLYSLAFYWAAVPLTLLLVVAVGIGARKR
jgi:hypothetical protein